METRELTWKCEVCKSIRPDDKISVFKRRTTLDDGIIITENIKYCNDRPMCQNNVHKVSLLPR